MTIGQPVHSTNMLALSGVSPQTKLSVPQARENGHLDDDTEAARLAALDALGILYTPIEQRYERLSRLVKNHFSSPVCLISLVARDTLWYKSVVGLKTREIRRCATFCEVAIEQTGLLHVENAAEDPRFMSHPLVCGEAHIRFYAGQPLRTSSNQRVGTLCIIGTEPRTLSLSEQQDLTDFAALVEREFALCEWSDAQRNLIVENNELRRRSLIDELTGLWNRRAITEILNIEAYSAFSKSKPLTVAMIDIDHFKAVNDSLGHAAGDEVLVEVCTRMSAKLRASEAIGRYGGEEFIVILPNTLVEGALIAKRILDAVGRNPIQLGNENRRVSVSIGVATLESGIEPTETNLAALLKSADRALYHAKETGRGRVCASSQMTFTTLK
jgi:diguanylate cyclase (GGDEF)-like protein